MKFTNKINILTSVVLIVMLSSCDDYLDVKIDNSYGDDITWSLPDYALGVLNNAYAGIPTTPDCFQGNYLDVATDNAVTNDFTCNLYDYVMGSQSPTSDPLSDWDNSYNQFRNIHLFLENGLGNNIQYDLFDAVTDSTIRARSKGEAYFLRAWWGMNLLQRYGGLSTNGEALGYPIVLKTLSIADKDNTYGRNTYEECVKQILADCDTAIYYLPLKYTGSNTVLGSTQDGRANGRAAYALKTRVTLFAASKAYQPENEYAIDQDSIIRKWKRVAVMADEAIKKGQIGNYSALTNAKIVGNGVQNTTDDELLFRKWFNNNTIEKNNFPPLFFGQAKTNPTQDLVNCYHSNNGFPITDTRSDYDPQNPYKSRDNRFENTIYYNGKVFNGVRPLEIFIDINGQKGQDVEGYDYKNTRTGYYLRKGMSEKKDMLYNPVTLTTLNDFHQFGLLRRSEVYFNYAEASNNAVGPFGKVDGCSKSAYDIIKEIRRLNGISSTVYLEEVAAQGKDAFNELIINERRVEFAFENMRFYDIRRNFLPVKNDLSGVKIVKNGEKLEYIGTGDSEEVIIEKRNLYDNKYYYSPIPYSEIIKNKKIVQNKGW